MNIQVRKIIFVSGTGKILAYSHTCEQDGSESIRWKHVTFSDYKKFCQGEADTKEHQLVLSNLLKQWEG